MAAILVAEDVRRNNVRRAYLWTVRILFFFLKLFEKVIISKFFNGLFVSTILLWNNYLRSKNF